MNTAALQHLPTHRGGHHPDGPTTIATFTGRPLDLANPSPDGICIEDIANGLSNACRFACQVRFYSVAEHAVLVHDLVRVYEHGPTLAAAALLHDAHEAYLGDVTTPLRAALGAAFDAYADLSKRMDTAVAHALGLDPRSFNDPIVKAADAWALVIEARQVAPAEGWRWARFADVPDLPETVTWAGGLAPEQAEQAFLARADAVWTPEWQASVAEEMRA